MKRKKTVQRSNARGFALFVGSLIGLLILVACSIKLLLLFRQSTFDTRYQFVLEEHETAQTRFFVFNPADSSMHRLLFTGVFSTDLQRNMGIPVDAVVNSSQDFSDPDTLMAKLLIHTSEMTSNLTPIDMMHIFLFRYTIDSAKTLSLQTSNAEDPTEQDALLTKIFIDKTLYQEGQSVTIVNGTGKVGLGNKIARLLTHIGGNVVSVITAQENSAVSTVTYTGNSSYSITRIASLLHLPEVHSSLAMISDITITLGTDKF